MTSSRTASEEVALVERRIETRRARTRRHWHEIKVDVRRQTRWAPLLGVAATAALGFVLGRQGVTRPPAAARPPTGASARWAAFSALAASALRIAFSPQVKMLWSAFKRGRAGGSP